MVHLALDARLTFDVGRHVGLAHQPGDEPLGDGVIVAELGGVVGPQDGRVLRLHCAHVGQAGLHQVADAAPQRTEVVGVAELPGDLLLQPEDPLGYDRTEGAGVPFGGAQALHRAAVDGLQAVQRRVVLRDLDLGDGKVALHGLLLVPAGREALAAAEVAPQCLEDRAAGSAAVQFLAQRPLEAIGADREEVQSPAGYGATPQGLHDIAAQQQTGDAHSLTP